MQEKLDSYSVRTLSEFKMQVTELKMNSISELHVLLSSSLLSTCSLARVLGGVRTSALQSTSTSSHGSAAAGALFLGRSTLELDVADRRGIQGSRQAGFARASSRAGLSPGGREARAFLADFIERGRGVVEDLFLVRVGHVLRHVPEFGIHGGQVEAVEEIDGVI